MTNDTTRCKCYLSCHDIARHLPYELGEAFAIVWYINDKKDVAEQIKYLNSALWLVVYWSNHPYPICAEQSVAQALFNLLEKDHSKRYFALRDIVGFPCGDAATVLENMIRELVEREKKNEALKNFIHDIERGDGKSSEILGDFELNCIIETPKNLDCSKKRKNRHEK